MTYPVEKSGSDGVEQHREDAESVRPREVVVVGVEKPGASVAHVPEDHDGEEQTGHCR